MSTAIVIGAGSAIGHALVERLADSCETVWAIQREANDRAVPAAVQCLYSDYTATSMADCVAALQNSSCEPDIVCICLGMLHDEQISPEKRIEDVELAALQQVLTVNAMLPILWLKHLLPVIRHRKPCRIAVLSARVGSIGDNRLGGWYAYRASKAALNMLLQNTAIELARRAKRVKLIAFHPGTTDTPLSQPFQTNVPEGKLFTPDFVAECLLQVLADTEPDGTLSYLDWDGKTIPW